MDNQYNLTNNIWNMHFIMILHTKENALCEKVLSVYLSPKINIESKGYDASVRVNVD